MASFSSKIKELISGLTSGNYLKSLLEKAVIAKQESEQTMSYQKWLQEKGLSTDSTASNYYAKSEEDIYNIEQQRLEQVRKQAEADAENERLKVSSAANNAYLRAVSKYGSDAAALTAAGLNNSGAETYLKGLAYNANRAEQATANKGYLQNIQNARTTYAESLADAQEDKIKGAEALRQQYLSDYEEYYSDYEKALAESTETSQINYNKLLENYVYRKDTFSSQDVIDMYQSGKLNDSDYLAFKDLYNSGITRELDSIGKLFTGDYETDYQLYLSYMADGLLSEQTRARIQEEFDYTSGGVKPNSAYMLTGKQQSSTISMEELFESVVNKPMMRNTQFIYTDEAGNQTPYRVDTYLNTASNTDAKVIVLKDIMESTSGGKVVIVKRESKTYMTDGKKVYELKTLRQIPKALRAISID